MRKWLVLVGVMTSACVAATAPSEGVDRELRLLLGEEASVDGGRLTLEFREVPIDSRCPADVQCVQAGEAVVVLGATQERRSAVRLNLRTTPGKESAAAGEYRVELLRLEPLPRSEGNPAEPYTATLRVTREQGG